MCCIETYKLFPSFPFECFLDPRQKFGVLELHLQLTLSGSFVRLLESFTRLVVWRNSLEPVSKHSTWLRGHPASMPTHECDMGEPREIEGNRQDPPYPVLQSQRRERGLRGSLTVTHSTPACFLPATQGSEYLPWPMCCQVLKTLGSLSCLARLPISYLSLFDPDFLGSGPDGDR